MKNLPRGGSWERWHTKPGVYPLLAIAGTVFLLLMLGFPLQSVYYRIENTIALPVESPPALVRFYKSQGLKVRQDSPWMLQRLLSSGSQFVYVPDILAKPALKYYENAAFTPVATSTVVAASRDSHIATLSDFAKLPDAAATVYFDQGVSRLEIMAALGLTVSKDAQHFSANRALNIASSLYIQKKLQVGSSLEDLGAALDKGWWCVSTDARLANVADLSALNVPSVPTLMLQDGVWARDGETPPKPPSGLINTRTHPTLAGHNYLRNATELSNLRSLEDFTWWISFSNQQYNGSDRWKNNNEAYRLASLITTLFLISLWGGWRFWTGPTTFVRRAVLVQAAVLSGWILVRILKHSFLFTFQRYLWYYYYVPIITSVVILFLVINHDSPKHPPGYRFMRLFCFVSLIVLIVAAYTNDLHHLLLRFGSERTDLDYSYGPIYYIYYAASVLIFGFILYTSLWLFKGNRRSIAWGMLLLFVTVMTYSIAYTLRVPLVRAGETSQSYTLLLLLAWEVMYFIGAIRQNRGYQLFFANAKIPVEIRDRDWEVLYHSGKRLNLGVREVDMLREGKAPFIYQHNGAAGLEQHYLQTSPMLGAHVVWRTNITLVKELEKTLISVRSQAEHQLAVLAKEFDALRKMEKSPLVPLLYDRLDSLMHRALVRAENQSILLAQVTDEAQLRILLRSIKLDLGYAKRVGLLVLSNLEDDEVTLNTLSTFLSQSCTDFSTQGVLVGLHGPTAGRIDLETAIGTLNALHRVLACLMGLSELVCFVSFTSESAQNAQLTFIFEENPQLGAALETIRQWREATFESDEDSLRLTLKVGAEMHEVAHE